jgi:DNA-binding beta-propeller fold protein YncE
VFKITEGNMQDVAGAVLIHAEYLQLNAELMITATLIAQLLDDGSTSVACSEGGGSLTIAHLDDNADHAISAGDRVRVGYVSCGTVTGSLILNIETVAQTGQTIDRLTGTVVQDMTLVGSQFNITIVANQRLSYEVGATGVRWETTDGTLISTALGIPLGTTQTSLSFAINADANTYELAISGVGNFAGNQISYGTLDSFDGLRGHFPTQGIAEFAVNGSAGRILHGDDPLRPTLARFMVDEDGNGVFAPFLYSGWDELFLGDMFAVPSAGTYVPMPGFFDVTSRNKNLRSEVGDVVWDRDRNQLYFSMRDRNEIAVVDADTLLIADRIPIGPGPEGLWLGADGNTLYAALSQGGSVGVLDLDSGHVEYIEVAAALGNFSVYDLVEAAPGIVYVAGNPGPVATGYLARIDREADDTVTRVANGRLLRDEPALAVDPLGQFLYAGDGDRLYKVDIAAPGAPVVAERQIAARRNLSVSGDGTRIYLNNGDILRTSNLQTLGTLQPGVPYALPNGFEVLMARSDFSIVVYEAQTRLLVDQLVTGCGAEGPLDTLIPYGDWGQWLMLGRLGFCAFDFRNPGTRPGSDVPIPHPEEPDIINVPSVTTLFGGWVEDIEYDAARGRIYLSDSQLQAIHAIDVETFAPIESFAIDGRPYGIDMDFSGSRLAIAIRDDLPLGILDLDTGDIESFDITAALGLDLAADVAFAADDAIFVVGNSGGASYLVRAYADGTPAVRIADGLPISISPQLLADPARQRLYAAERASNVIYAIDASLEEAPIISSIEVDDSFNGRGFAMSPDALSLAVPFGVVVRTADLSQRGTMDSGAPVFAADGSSIAVFRPNGVVNLYHPGTFTLESIVDPSCDDIPTSPYMMQIGDRNDWIAYSGGRICRFSLPESDSQSMKLQSQLESKPMLPYFCDSDCITRRLVLPSFGRSAGRDYSALRRE